MILWIPCLKWRVNICEKIWEALFADFKFLFLFIFCELYDKLLQKFDACDFIFSCKKKKGIYNSLYWHLKCIVQSLINVDNSIKIHLNETFFIADAVSLTVFSRAGAHKHSPEFPIPEMQILASAWFFSSVKCKFLSSFFKN